MNHPKYDALFVQEMKRRNYSANSIETYKGNIKTFFEYFKQKEHPKHINESDVKQLLATFDEPNTQRSIHSAVKLFYNICMGQSQKFKYIPYARKSKKLPIVLSASEIQRMFDVCENLKHRVILALLYSCGIRVSELINLEWSHIDRSRMIINIIQAKGKKDRQVMLTPKLIPLLIAYYRQYKPVQHVLNGQSTVQYSERSVGQVIKQLAAKAGIKNKRVYTHLMRHCSFTHMVEQGIDIKLIQRVAGHNNVKTTDMYCHISNNVISKIRSPFADIRL